MKARRARWLAQAICSLLAAVLGAGEGHAADDPVLHLIVAADTNDVSIGTHVAVDRSTFTAKFEAHASAVQMTVRKKVFVGSNWKKDRIAAAIRDLTVAPDDVVVFFAACHGFTPETRRHDWPFLAFGSTAWLDTYEEVYRPLLAKSPRLLLVASDCCSSVARGFTAPPPSQGGTNVVDKAANLRRLLRQARGGAICTGATPPEPAWGGPNGGLFTNQLLSAIDAVVSTQANATWDMVFQRADKKIENIPVATGVTSQQPHSQSTLKVIAPAADPPNPTNPSAPTNPTNPTNPNAGTNPNAPSPGTGTQTTYELDRDRYVQGLIDVGMESHSARTLADNTTFVLELKADGAYTVTGSYPDGTGVTQRISYAGTWREQAGTLTFTETQESGVTQIAEQRTATRGTDTITFPADEKTPFEMVYRAKP